MNTIYKYPFETDGSVLIELPKGAEILTVQTQKNTPCIWALVAPKEKRIFEIYGTGHPIHERIGAGYRKYIGTYQLMNGSLIFHLFEIELPF